METRVSKTMAVSTTTAGRRKRQRSKHDRIRRQNNGALPVFKSGRPPRRHGQSPSQQAIPAAVTAAAVVTSPIMTAPTVIPQPKIDPSSVDADSALPIEELEFTTAVYNRLKNDGINTVGELTERTEASLMDIKQFGGKSLEEVKTKLAGMGLSLGFKWRQTT